MDYFTIADQQYFTTKEVIKGIFENSGFSIVFKPESIKGKFRKGYYRVVVSHSFRCFADKLRASKTVKLEFDKLEVC